MARKAANHRTPSATAKEVLAQLRTLGDPEVAARGRSYFKEADDITLLGVKAPQIRALAGAIHDRVKHTWGASEAERFCELLAQRPEFEAKMVGVLVLARFHRAFPRSLVSAVREWIVAGWFCNWAAIDGLCAVTTALVRRHPDLLSRVTRWVDSPVLWLRRAAVVTLVPLARRGESLEEAYAVVEALLDDDEDLMHKACGWLLREAGKTDRDRLEKFLLRHNVAIPRTTVRYAIERFPEKRRRRLLVATRG